MIKKIFILFCFISVIVVSLYAQPEIRNLSLYDAKSDVYYFIERQYKARMAFGELEKGDLLETNYYRFDKSGNLVFFETEGKDKEGKSKKENKQYTYNAQKQLIQVLNSDLSKIVFTYNNGKLTQFDRYDKSGKLLERTKRKYSSPSNFIDIEYNSKGNEEKQYTYKNGLLVSEKTSTSNKTYTYNAQRKQTLVQYSGKEFNAGDIVGALMWANVTGDVDAISNIKGKSVSSSIRNTYNSKGLLTKAVTTKSNAQSETVIFQYEYDSKGNWIKNIASYSGPKLNEFIIIFEREIVYYSNKEQQPTYTSLTAIEKSKLPDVDAEFPEGSLGIQKYLTANAKYPMEAMENGVMGDVKVSFTINEDGSISDPQITKTVSQALDKEVIRVINSMPKWKPAIKDEKQIKTKKELKIRFRLLGFGEYSITLLK